VLFRKAIIAGMLGAAALLPTRNAAATDLKLSLGAAGEYDSNIFHRETQILDDFVVIGIPQLELLDTEGKLTYDVGYVFPYQHSIETNALRDFSHIANLSADYHLSDQTQFSFSNRFSYLNSLNNSFDSSTPNIADNQKRQQVLRNDASLGAVYLISPRLSSESSFDQGVFSSSQEDRSDNQTYSLATGLDYLVSERQRAGGGLSFSYLNFQNATENVSFFGIPATQDIPASESIFVGPYLQWSYQIDEQSRFRISGGPNYVKSKQEKIVVRLLADPSIVLDTQSSASDSRVAFLGSFLLDRRWSPTMISALQYQRRQDTASGVSGSAILDAVALTHSWNFAETWTLGLRGDWTQRKGATNLDQGGLDQLDTQRWGAGTVLSKQITRNFAGSLRYQYAKQNSASNSAGSSTDFDDHIVTLGFNYSLDPIKVW
jgi:hypothetical protein